MSTSKDVVPMRLRCKGCGNLSDTSSRRPGDTCELRIDTHTLGRVVCGGIYVVTKGQQFKNLHGYSKTLQRNMRRNGLDPNAFSDSIAACRAIRKARKKKQKALQRAKHDAARAERAGKASKPKTSKKQKK